MKETFYVLQKYSNDFTICNIYITVLDSYKPELSFSILILNKVTTKKENLTSLFWGL